MTINFYLDSKINRKGKKAVYCRISGVKNKAVYIKTGVNVNPKDWNTARQEVRKSDPEYPVLNNYLSNLASKIRKEYFRLWQDSNTAFDTFKQNFKSIVKDSSSEENDDFVKTLNMFLEFVKTQRSKKTLHNYKTLEKHVMNFEQEKKYKLTFDTLDMNFFDKFLDYMYNDLELTNNTVLGLIKQLKTFLNWAKERNYTTNEEYKKFTVKNFETEVIFLTYDELMRLYNMDLSKNKLLDTVRDFFCLGCFTGQRFSDIASIKPDDIKDNIWYVRTVKNRELLKVYLNDYAWSIIDKYFSKDMPFPAKSNQQMNVHLKKLCKLAEINEPIKRVRYRGSEKIEITKPKYEFIGTHTARKTFVTLSLEKGMRPETVMSITGHNDYKTMRRYLAITGIMKENEMKRVWNKK